LSAEPQTVRFDGTLFPDDYADYFAGERLELLSDTEMTLNPWAYKGIVAEADTGRVGCATHLVALWYQATACAAVGGRADLALN